MQNPFMPPVKMTKAKAYKSVGLAAAVAIIKAAVVVFFAVQAFAERVEIIPLTIYQTVFLLGVAGNAVAAVGLIFGSRLAVITLVVFQAINIVNLTLYSASLDYYLLHFGVLYIYIRAVRATFHLRNLKKQFLVRTKPN